MDESRKVAIRVGVTLLGWAIGYALFGTETKFGPITAMAACGITAMGIGYLFTSGDSESTATSGSAYAPAPMTKQSSLSEEKTCPACISQVPFIASKCKFCGIDLVVEDLSHIKKAFEETERKEREAENLRRQTQEDAERLQKERTAFEHSETERLRKEHLESLSPLKRFLTVRKLPLSLALVGLVVSALIIPGQISKAREASEREQARQQAKQSAAAAEESNRAEALANAEKYVAEFEAQYCQLLNSALKDSEFRRFISNEANDMSEADEDVVKEKYYVGLVEIYTKYTSLGVTLGADRANFVSPVLELHIGSYGLSNDSTNIIAQCSAY